MEINNKAGTNQNKSQVNMVESNYAGPSFRSVSINPSINFTYQNSDWWLDSGANTNVCTNKYYFSSYQITSGRSVTVANGTFVKVLGVGEIKLNFTSGKSIILHDVQHVPGIGKNLISVSLLVQLGYKVVLESNKVVISKHDVFIGKGYVSDGLFKLNIISQLVNEVSMISDNFPNCSASSNDNVDNNKNNLVDNWHGRLGHVNYQKLVKCHILI
jgi:hypothetical protein